MVDIIHTGIDLKGKRQVFTLVGKGTEFIPYGSGNVDCFSAIQSKYEVDELPLGFVGQLIVSFLKSAIVMQVIVFWTR